MEQHLEHVMDSVQHTGQALVGDGWGSNTNRPLLNFIAVTTKGAKFMHSVDTSQGMLFVVVCLMCALHA